MKNGQKVATKEGKVIGVMRCCCAVINVNVYFVHTLQKIAIQIKNNHTWIVFAVRSAQVWSQIYLKGFMTLQNKSLSSVWVFSTFRLHLFTRSSNVSLPPPPDDPSTEQNNRFGIHLSVPRRPQGSELFSAVSHQLRVPQLPEEGEAAKNKRPRGLGSYQPVAVNLISGCRFNDGRAGAGWMKLSRAGQVLKGPFFPNKRSEGASFCLATHPMHGNAHRSDSHVGNAALCPTAANFHAVIERKILEEEEKWSSHFFYFCHHFLTSCSQVSEQIRARGRWSCLWKLQ